jgi:hypothetical protein
LKNCIHLETRIDLLVREIIALLSNKLVFFLQGSTVNMNIMQPIYKLVSDGSAHKGYVSLGIVLFIGMYVLN